MLQSMGLQRVGHNRVTELNSTDQHVLIYFTFLFYMYIYFTLWVIIPYCVIYFVYQSVLTSAIEIFLPLTSFDMSPSICLSSTFFLFGNQDAPGLSFILPASALASGTSPRSPGSFCLRTVSRNQVDHQVLTSSLVKQRS